MSERFAKIPRWLLWLLAAAALLAAARWGEQVYQRSRVDTDELFQQAAAATAAVTSYRFSVQSLLLLNNYTNAETLLTGERDQAGNLHVWGEMLATPVEIYQFGDDHYRCDQTAGRWLHLTNSPLPANALLLCEIDPLRNLLLTEAEQVRFTTRERRKGRTLYHYELALMDGAHPAAAFFENFTLELTVDGKTTQVTEAVLRAQSRVNENGEWKLQLTFAAQNETIEFSPPL